MTRSLLLAAAVLSCAASLRADPSKTMEAAIDGLRAKKILWREISWKSSLVEALHASRARKKPVVCWVFIDRPADDARC